MKPLFENVRAGRRIALVLTAVSLLAGSPNFLRAQSDTGRVTGTVADSVQAVIPGASVTLTDKDTGVSQTRVTGSDGNYTFQALMPGHYRIETTAPGFASQKQEFELQIQQVDTITFNLKAGDVST